MIRDTAFYKPLCPDHPRALRVLASEQLGIEIQKSHHDSVVDARVALLVYKKHAEAWEQLMRQRDTNEKQGKKTGKKQKPNSTLK